MFIKIKNDNVIKSYYSDIDIDIFLKYYLTFFYFNDNNEKFIN